MRDLSKKARKSCYRGHRHPADVSPMQFYNGTPCMPWPAAKVSGYGVININGKPRKAHRVIYENHKGPIPDGLVLDHLCRNHKCVNPDHLEAVTQKINTIRGIGPSAMNSKKTHCKNGHPFSDENTRAPTGRVHRTCRTCVREQMRARRRALAGIPLDAPLLTWNKGHRRTTPGATFIKGEV